MEDIKFVFLTIIWMLTFAVVVLVGSIVGDIRIAWIFIFPTIVTVSIASNGYPKD